MIKDGNGFDYLIYSDANIEFDSNFQTQSLRIKDPILDNSHSYNIDNFISYIENEEKGSQTFLTKIEDNKSKFILAKIIVNLQAFQKFVNNIVHNVNTINGDFANLDVHSYIQQLVHEKNDKIVYNCTKDSIEHSRELKQLKIAFEGLNSLLTKSFSNEISGKLLKNDLSDDIKQKVYVN